MHKELIGQEASLSFPCDVAAATLLLGFIDELMEVSGSEMAEPEALERELVAAVGSMCADGGAEDVQVVATFDIQARGVEVHLTCEKDGTAVDGAVQVVAAREA